MQPNLETISFLYESSLKIRSARTVSELSKYLVSILKKGLRVDLVSVWLLHKPEMVLTCVVIDGYGKERFEKKTVKLGTGVLGKLLQNRRELWISSEDDPEDLLPSFAREWGIKSSFFACVSLVTEEELFGAVIISNRIPCQEDGQIRSLDSLRKLVYSSALALEDISNREKLAKRIRDLTTLAEIGVNLSSCLELDKILRLLLFNIMGHFIVEHIAILLVDEKENRLVPVESHGLSESVSNLDFSGEGTLAESLGKIKVSTVSSVVESYSLPLEEQKRLQKLKAALLVPIIMHEEILGLITLGEKLTHEPYEENEIEFLSTIANQAGIAIKNAMLFQAERKAKELSLLLEISKEITATLDLDRIMSAFVNLSSQVIEYDRAAIGLFHRDTLRISAISGQEKVDRKMEEVSTLEKLLSWVGKQKLPIYVSSLGEEIQAENEETKEKLKQYFQLSEMRSFLAIPLVDEEGILGVMSMESQAHNFLTESSLEVVEILSNQLTVALRNAELYQQIPLAKVIHPIVSKKRALFKMPRKKLGLLALTLGLFLSFLIFWKSELKVSCPAVMWPLHTYTVTAEVEGIVKEVLVREGETVEAGQVLAKLYNEDIYSRLNEAQLQIKTSRETARNLFAASRINQYQIEKSQINKLETEISLLKSLQDKTKMTSPITGKVLTPRLEEKVGEFLEKGDSLCQVADLDEMRAELQFPGKDINLVKENQKVKLLVSAFPQGIFWGVVEKVSSKANPVEEGKRFTVIAQIDNIDGLLRPGMTGQAKVYCGKKSLAYNILRKPARLFREVVWKLFGF